MPKLAAEHLFVFQSILIQPLGEPEPVAQEVVFLPHKAGDLGVAQLHIAAGGAHHKVDDERQPVGGLIEQQHQGCPLPQIPCRQRNGGQHGSQHTRVEAVHRADEHDEHQPEIDHLELGVGAGGPYQHFREEPCG